MLTALEDFLNSITTKKATYILIAVGFITYFNSLFNGFVWEDTSLIFSRILSQNLDIVKQFASDGAFNTGGRYMPITGVYAAVTQLLFSQHPFFYHFLQLLLHITNSILLFLVFRNLFGKNLAFFLSIIFIVHPINVEAVSYMAAFNSTLFFFFGIIALYLSTLEKIDNKKAISIYVLLLLSCLTRENGLIFAFILFIYQLLFKRRDVPRIFLAGLLSVLTYLGIRLVTAGFKFVNYEQVPIAELSFNDRILNIPAEIFYYLKSFVYPIDLAVNQRWIIKELNFNNFYFPLFLEVFLLIVVVSLIIYFFRFDRKKSLILLFFFLWFATGMSLYLNIIPLDMTVADRWFYFPIVGITGIVGVLLNTLRIKAEILKISLIFLGILLISLFSLRTLIRNTNFYDTVTLFEHDARVSDNFDIQNVLGINYQNRHDYNTALTHYKKSIEYSQYSTNTYNLASLYSVLGDYKNSEKYYSQIIEMSKTKSFPKIFTLQVYADYAMVNYLKEDYDEALRAASKAMEIESKPSTRELYRIILNREQLVADRFKPI